MNKEAGIKVFKRIRDIPYRIPLNLSELDQCCSGKHIELKAELEKAGYTVRHRVCTFRWSSLDLPETLCKLPHQDTSTHSYLEILVGLEWITVDATWDTRISSILPRNTWDGSSKTPIAVAVEDIFSPEESEKIMTQGSNEETLADLRINGEFYNGFNEWLEEVRKKHLSV